MINQLQHNILWGQKGNFVDVPTDCPQRDERLGWTGDAQVFIRTACFNMDVVGSSPSGCAIWLPINCQLAACPLSCPMCWHAGTTANASCVAQVRRPGAMPPSFARGRFTSAMAMCVCWKSNMPAWPAGCNYMREHADADMIWRKGFHFGDWLDYRGTMALMPSPVTNTDLIAHCVLRLQRRVDGRDCAHPGQSR